MQNAQKEDDFKILAGKIADLLSKSAKDYESRLKLAENVIRNLLLRVESLENAVSMLERKTDEAGAVGVPDYGAIDDEDGIPLVINGVIQEQKDGDEDLPEDSVAMVYEDAACSSPVIEDVSAVEDGIRGPETSAGRILHEEPELVHARGMQDGYMESDEPESGDGQGPDAGGHADEGPQAAEGQPVKRLRYEELSLFDIPGPESSPSWKTDMPGPYITHISHGISINDKIRYINELFGGDSSLYREVVGHLDELPAFAEAESYLNARFPEWNPDSDAVYGFYMAIRRKLRA